MKILQAEDNLVNKKLLEAFVSRMGHEIFSVENGREALEALEQEKYDLVLMDIQMPVMDGIEALKKIKLDARLEDLPVIAVSAYSSPEDEVEFINLGFNSFISKPVDFDRLKEVIIQFDI